MHKTLETPHSLAQASTEFGEFLFARILLYIGIGGEDALAVRGGCSRTSGGRVESESA